MVAPGRTMVAFFKACANDWVGKEKTGRPRRGSSRKRWLSKDSITGTRVSLAGCSPAEPASVSPSFCRAGGVCECGRGKSEGCAGIRRRVWICRSAGGGVLLRPFLLGGGKSECGGGRDQGISPKRLGCQSRSRSTSKPRKFWLVPHRTPRDELSGRLELGMKFDEAAAESCGGGERNRAELSQCARHFRYHYPPESR